MTAAQQEEQQARDGRKIRRGPAHRLDRERHVCGRADQRDQQHLDPRRAQAAQLLALDQMRRGDLVREQAVADK
jgi:hypothetical protein